MSAPYYSSWEPELRQPILISEVSETQRTIIREEIAYPFEKARKKRLAKQPKKSWLDRFKW